MARYIDAEELISYINGIYDDDCPTTEIKIPTGIEPRYKCKNKFLQKILTKIFGYTITYETRLCKVIINKAEEFPYKNGFDGSLTIDFNEMTVERQGFLKNNIKI